MGVKQTTTGFDIFEMHSAPLKCLYAHALTLLTSMGDRRGSRG